VRVMRKRKGKESDEERGGRPFVCCVGGVGVWNIFANCGAAMLGFHSSLPPQKAHHCTTPIHCDTHGQTLRTDSGRGSRGEDNGSSPESTRDRYEQAGFRVNNNVAAKQWSRDTPVGCRKEHARPNDDQPH